MDLATLRKRNADASLRIERDVVFAGGSVEEPGSDVMPLELLAAADNLFADRGLQPDNVRAYMQFNLCRAFPNIVGPTMSGNLIGNTAAALERNHHKLVNTQINLDHRIRSYDEQNIPRDRIIGACVATHFPKAPQYGGWKGVMPETAAAAPEITAMAVLWKAAEGMRQFLGEHLSGRGRRAVSIELTSDLENLGVYVPSTRQIFRVLDAPDEIAAAIGENPRTGGLSVGRLSSGEQLVLAYGGEAGEIEMRGTGVVGRGADPTAKIQFIRASLASGELCSLECAAIPQMLVGRAVRTLRSAAPLDCEIVKVHTSGLVGPPHGEWKLDATPCNPVLELHALAGKRPPLWWRLSEVMLLS